MEEVDSDGSFFDEQHYKAQNKETRYEMLSARVKELLDDWWKD